MDIPTRFIWIFILFDIAFKYGDVAKFWGYVGINAEPVCVEFCSVVQNVYFIKFENLFSVGMITA
jgi:hypothetical protein